MMHASRNFLDFDSTILAKLSDSLKDKISAKAFVNLQRKSDHELRAVRTIVQALLDEEQQIQTDTDRLIDTHDLSRQRKVEVQFCDWERLRYLPSAEWIHTQMENGFPVKRKQLKAMFCQYLDHLNRVVSRPYLMVKMFQGNVHLDTPAEDKYDPFQWNEDDKYRKSVSDQ
ncbi:unnamed protein product [Echinostoma caproni]|uniref:Peptidase_M3 domain-containing protein n=1 Tax=Echinostoma caproni TaxID=27848 RepID=A0A183ANP3_9TREM|nr:unnamed protein product [Echinostoma caproni]